MSSLHCCRIQIFHGFNVVGKQRRNAETSGTSLLTAAPVDSLSDVVLDTALSHFDVDLRSVACQISPTPVIFGDLQGNFSCALQSHNSLCPNFVLSHF